MLTHSELADGLDLPIPMTAIFKRFAGYSKIADIQAHSSWASYSENLPRLSLHTFGPTLNSGTASIHAKLSPWGRILLDIFGHCSYSFCPRITQIGTSDGHLSPYMGVLLVYIIFFKKKAWQFVQIFEGLHIYIFFVLSENCFWENLKNRPQV